MSYFESALDLHKAKFEEYRALIVIDDKTLRRYAMAWSPLLVRLQDEWPLDNGMVDLWKCVVVDFQALADLTGDTIPEVMGTFQRAKGLHLIYPDGSVPAAVKFVLLAKLREITAI